MNYKDFEKQYMADRIRANNEPSVGGKAGVQLQKATERQQINPPTVDSLLNDVGVIGSAYLDMGAATTKGMVQGAIGLPGDIEGLVRTVANSLGAEVSEETLLPATESVKKYFDENLGKVGDGNNPYETLGEFAAPGVVLDAAVPTARAIGKGVKKAGEVIDENKELLRPVGSIRMGGGGNDEKKLAPNKVIKLNTQKKKKKEKFRDESSGHAADYVPAQFGPQAHKMNTRFDDEFTPDGYSTFSADIGDNYENLKYFISSRKGTKEFNEEVAFYRKLFEIKDNPDAEITVYRASPTDDLRYGDLITPIKSDAEYYVEESKITREDIRKAEKEQRLSGDEPVDLMREKNIKIIDNLFDMFPDNTTPSQLFSYKVKAKDIRWDGNNGLIRWGYFPTGDVQSIGDNKNLSKKPMEKSKKVESEILSEKENEFENLAINGNVRQAEGNQESFESIFKDENVRAQDIEIIGDDDFAFDYESGNLEQRLNEAGLSYKDNRMGSLIIGKSIEDVKTLEKALKDNNQYAMGKMYGYSEEDIAAFYKQKYARQGLPAFKYYIQDKFRFENPDVKSIKNKKLIDLLSYDTQAKGIDNE